MARKSSAPSFIAATASWMLPKAVITMTGSSGSSSLAARSTPKPSPSGSRRSDSTRPGRDDAQHLHRLGLVARLDDGVPLRLERVAQHRPQRVLVLDEEDGRIGRSVGPLAQPARRHAGAARFFFEVGDGLLRVDDRVLEPVELGEGLLAIGLDHGSAAPDRRG